MLQGAEWKAIARAAVWGTQVAAVERLHAQVERDTATSLRAGAAGVVSSVKDNRLHGGALSPAHTWRDAGGLIHDVHGRVERVARDGIATVKYEYDAATGLLSAKHLLSPEDEEVRSVSWQHDAIGRATHEVHTDVVSGATQTYRFYYDGATPEHPEASDWPGLLTAVTGEGYTKVYGHRADGKLLRSALTLEGWRTVETEVVRYAENDEIAEETTTVKDGSGQVLSAVTRRYGWNTHGALSTMHVNGELLATFGYL